MSTGSCDPGPGNYNVTQLSKDNGRATITIRSTWDGVSTWPDCDGPIVDVTLRNTSPTPWLLSLPVGRAARTRIIASGANRVFVGAQLTPLGLTSAADVLGLLMTTMAVNS
jgi:hypothetical protein